MQDIQKRQDRPRLKELVVEASQALARLDADRLEELALSCQVLNRALGTASPDGNQALASEAVEATGEMAVLARVLEATQANLNVMNRLRDLRESRLEYGAPRVRGWSPTGSGHGDN